MSMRMSPAVAAQPALPTVNRTSLVFFAGLILLVLNFAVANGVGLFHSIFTKGGNGQPLVGVQDAGLQLLGVALLTLMAEYGGDDAGSFALVFIGALWLLWLLGHAGKGSIFPPSKEAAPSTTETNTK